MDPKLSELVERHIDRYPDSYVPSGWIDLAEDLEERLAEFENDAVLVRRLVKLYKRQLPLIKKIAYEAASERDATALTVLHAVGLAIDESLVDE